VHANDVIPVVTAVVSGPLVWGALQQIMTRKRSSQEEARKQLQHDQQLEKEREERQLKADERRELLAEAQATAQRTALASADDRYEALHEDFTSCRTSLVEVREVAWLLVDLFEQFLGRATTESDGYGDKRYVVTLQLADLGEARRGINEARRRLR
jgi:hypothetical protein